MVSGGTLDLINSLALQNSLVVAPTVGSLVFSSSVANGAFTLGGLTGSGNMSLENDALAHRFERRLQWQQHPLLGPVVGPRRLDQGRRRRVDSYGPEQLLRHHYREPRNTRSHLSRRLSHYGSASTLAVNDGAVPALSVGGTGWAPTDVGNLLAANGAGFAVSTTAGSSSLGIDTTNASFAYSSISGGMGLTKLGVNTLTLTGASTFTGPTLVSNGTLQLGDGTAGHDGSISGTAGITDNAALVYNLAGPQTYASAISGTGILTKMGGGILTLTGASPFSGSTTISGGTLDLASAFALQNSVVVAPTPGVGWLAFDQLVSGNNFTLGGLTGTGNISLLNNASTPAAVTLNVGNNNANTTYSGQLSGLGSLTKVGSGELTLTGTNIYAGSTTVSGGTLAVTSPSATSGYATPSMVAVYNGGMLALNVGGTGWAAADVANLLTASGTNFASGSALGIDTTNANFVYGTLTGNLGLTKPAPTA